MGRVLYRGILFCGALLAAPATVWAADCTRPVGRLVSLQGTVEVRNTAQTGWRPAQLHEAFCPGDALRTGARARAAVELSNETIVRLDQRTTLTLTGLDEASGSWMDLLNGAAHFLSRTPRALKVKTPYVNAGVEGTEFVVRAESGEGSVTVIEGRVLADNAQGAVTLTGGQAAAARSGQAPVLQTVVRLRDAVQWSLYYPPLFDDKSLTGEAAWLDAARRAVAAATIGNMTDAFAVLASVPETRDARFFNLRAGLFLAVGRLDEAQGDIASSMTLAPENAHATALRSIESLARGETSTALTLAQRAVQQDSASVPAWVALSYSRQAAFDFDGALASIERAQQLNPENVLVAARHAELLMSLGDHHQALAVAERASSLNPNSARVHTVLGFVLLTRLKTGDARLAFEKAVGLDSADPLPRLGLGLAVIRQGDLVAGRRELEIAAALDPNNALIRSYLGKAYYEERRNRLAAVQFDMARQLDPNDPTPWFYDAIRKQTENQPVEALGDLQKSVELNDNRAVYRSRLLLDQDLAARSASLARIYSDLGFQQLALVEGWKSLNTDPANYSAHQFLADSYAGLPRHEIGRVSELLQAQLLQPLSLYPVQPQRADSKFTGAGGGGPALPGYNEYNSLFVRDRVALQADGFAGSNKTLSDELAVSGLHGPVSWSIGQFHYQTDGFRRNGDYKQNLYNVFGQMALSPASSLQVEVRSSQIEYGDIALRLNPVLYPNDRTDKQTQTARLGFHYGVRPGSDFIASLIVQHNQETQHREEFLDPITLITSDARIKPEGYLAEMQHLYHQRAFNLISGVGYYDENSARRVDYEISIGGVPIVTDGSTTPTDTRHTNAYAYSQYVPGRRMILTLGLSYDNFERGEVDKSQFNPKLGVIWNPAQNTTLRFAAFRTLKRALLSDQTIEPTQVAGFAQYFDDNNATDAKRYGAAIDQRFGSNLWGGLEISHRDLTVITDFSAGIEEDMRENLLRLYLYHVLSTRWVFGAEYLLETYEREYVPFVIDQPKELTTHRLPLTLNYFHPTGWFAGLKVTPVVQKAQLPDGFGLVYTASEGFWLTDIAAGYRFPSRRSLITFGVWNLFDRSFQYQDANFQTNEPRLPAYQPERTVGLRARFVF